MIPNSGSNHLNNQQLQLAHKQVDHLEYSELSLQFIYIDCQILVVCTGLSGESYSFIQEQEVEQILKKSIDIHRQIDNFSNPKSDKNSSKAGEKDSNKIKIPPSKEKLARNLRELGKFLFHEVFKHQILDLLNVAIGQSIEQRKDILIRLMIGSDFLNLVPWELFFSEGRYLCHIYDIVRHPFSLQPVRRPSTSSEKVRLLFIGANPPGSYINVKESQEVIEAILDETFLKNDVNQIKDKIHFDKITGEKCTYKEIANKIFDGVDILHFLGHGECKRVGKNLKYSFIIHSEKESSGSDRLPVEMLESFCRASPMRLAILNACNSDYALTYKDNSSLKKILKQSSQADFYSMAHALLRTGVPCVVGMSHRISKIGAAILTRRLYRAIIEREESVNKAIRQVRLELFAHAETDLGSIYPSDWLTPILYLRGQSYVDGTMCSV